MPDNITFLTIPIDWRVPGQYIEIDPTQAVRGLPGMPRRLLLIGQRLPSGSAPAGEVRRISRSDDGVDYFGRGSMLARMIAAAMKVNASTETWALSLDDFPDGVAASTLLSVSGTPAAAGVPALYIGGDRVPIGMTPGASSGEIAESIASAINSRLDLPVTAEIPDPVEAPGEVRLTARHKGQDAGMIDARWNYHDGEAMPPGVDVVIAPLTTGAGNPDVLEALSAVSAGSFYSIVIPWTDPANMDAIEDELAGRWGGMDMRAGHVFVARSGTFSELAAYGGARNSPHSTVFGLHGSPTPPWIIASQAAAGVALRGANDPAMPFRGIALPDVLAPSEAERFTPTERNLLLQDGISTIIFDESSAAMIEQVITTYQTNSFGLDDRSLLKLNTKWTVDYLRYVFRGAVARDYPNHKLAGDDVLARIAPGQKIATPRLIRNTLIAAAAQLEYVGLLEDLEGFKENLKVLRSEADECRVNAVLPPNVVNQFDVFAAAVQFIL